MKSGFTYIKATCANCGFEAVPTYVRKPIIYNLKEDLFAAIKEHHDNRSVNGMKCKQSKLYLVYAPVLVEGD